MTPLRWPSQFVRFLYDFLVGETPELFVGPIVAIAIVAALIAGGVPTVAAAAVLVAGILGVAALALRLALRGAR